ncbi:hypothetical protein HMPREF7215_1980 [Pyramidobacter piscolens W5455]|uniref:Uncharacterized protein n=1 Tax=Pyramidobacter piscolens W5455 TaxID=352165 RepID=A0ABM9ZVQ9_9BACT|nr:hypothetical protein HMPREF7215_1980 [Pyramidobacter piscolens W5455]
MPSQSHRRIAFDDDCKRTRRQNPARRRRVRPNREGSACPGPSELRRAERSVLFRCAVKACGNFVCVKCSTWNIKSGAKNAARSLRLGS